MKIHYVYLFLLSILAAGCSKDTTSSNPDEGSSTISFAPSFKVSSDFPTVKNGINWQHPIGGKALLELKLVATDKFTGASHIDSLNLKDLGSFKKSVITGTYDIQLKSNSTAVADTFVRFTAISKNISIQTDGAIKLPATTSDGLILIQKELIRAGTIPTFQLENSLQSLNLGLFNGYYFLYARGDSKGRLTFTEASTGDLFMADIAVNSLIQQNFTPKISGGRFIIADSQPFK